jgi:16S rRNA (cytosine967-C5)-methyltransferase
VKKQPNIRFYPNLIQAVIIALKRIFIENEQAGAVVEETLKSNKKWGSRDRRFIAESIYDIIRWYRLLYEVDGQEPKKDADWWRLFGILQILSGRTLPEWKEFEGVDEKKVLEKYEELKEDTGIVESIPQWLHEIGEGELGAELWKETVHSLNENASLVLRVNTLNTNVKSLIKALNKEGVEGESIGGEGVVLKNRRKLASLQSFRNGFFEVQDFGSQQIAPYLEAEAGMLVIDACAGAGGKTLHLASLMGNKGKIKALDIRSRQLRELDKRAKRNGATIIQSQKVSDEVIEGYQNKADRVLLDVPCTGLGTLKRKPDGKWKLTQERLDTFRTTQAEILESYSKMLKVGGKLVYATCSVLPSENEDQVQSFLAKQPDNFKLLKEQNIRPQEGYDGFYMALLERIA